MKRIIAMLLAIVMLVGNVPVQAFATDTEAQETTPCPVEGCTYGAGHTGECSTFVACGQEGCTYAAGHEGNCSNYVAPEEPKAEPAADAAVYVTVSNRGELGMAYEEVTVSDINKDGKLSVDEALYAAHVVYGKGYTSQNGTVTQLWGVETTNISFFVNHSVISTDVCAETIGSGDYLVASVDQDAVNDYDKYSRFNDMEKTVKAGEAFTLTLTDDAGNALAGMEVGLSNGNGSTTMTGLTTDVNGSVTLALDQEGLYCITAKGTVVESSIDVNTMEITSIETPIIAPACVVTVTGTAAQEQSMVYMQEVQSTSRSVAAAAEDVAGTSSEESYTFETGLKAEATTYSNITRVTLTGAIVSKVEVNESGDIWDVVLSACEGDLGIELKLENTKTNYLSKAYVDFNGAHTSASSGTFSTTVSPGLVNDGDTVSYTFESNYNGGTGSKRHAFTLNLTLRTANYVNQAPQLAGADKTDASIRTDEVYTLDLNTVFSDPENDPLTFTVAVDGAEAQAAEAAYTYTPEGVENKQLVFTATDPSGNVSAAYTVNLTVSENSAPVLSGAAEASADGMHGIAYSVDLSQLFADADGDVLAYTVAINGADAVPANASYSYTPAAAGIHTLVFQATDVKGATSPVYTLTLNAAQNAAPTLTGAEAAEVSVDQYSAWSIDLASLFADNEGDSLTYTVAIDDADPISAAASYSYIPTAVGQQTLAFQAADLVGNKSPEYTVTLTVIALDMSSGAWINYATSNGSLDYVQFTDAEGNHIDGIDAAYDNKKITVVLPESYPVNGTVKATFSLTQNGSVPFLTTSTETSGTSTATDKKFNEKTFTLSGGAAALTFYYYNTAPTYWGDNNPETWSITYSIANKLPILVEDVSATAEATITAGENYTLDLTTLFTDADGDPMTYLVSIDGAAAVAADAAYSYTTNTAGTYTLVFTANDGKGTSTETYTVTLTVENSTATKSMTVSLPVGLEPKFYVSTGFGDDGIDTLGDEVTATMSDTGYTLTYPANAEMLSVRAEGWGGMAFAAAENTSVTLRQVQMNVVDYDNNPAESTNTVTYDSHTAAEGTEGWLLVTGIEYTYTAVPKDTALATAAKKEILAAGTESHTVELMLGISNPLTITVPTGAKAQLYNYNTSKYYVATELEAKIVKDNGDGTTTYSFIGDTKANGACFIYRVSMPGKITKAGYLAWGKQNVTVTYTDADKSNTYRLDDYSGTGQANSGMAEDSVLLNINGQNHLAMNVGDTKTLKAYRVWEIIKISYQNYIITPDFTYNILSGSDVVRLTDVDSPSVGEGDWKKLEAIGNGTAVIEVTYDAMEVSGGSYDGIYGASDPTRTGLVVVQVGGNDASVNFGIDCFASRGISGSSNVTYNPNNKRAWDAEFDTLYFTGTSGELTFSPTASGAISEVAVSNNKGASWAVLTEQDGVYTAPIVSGNNILRVTTTAGTAYQVVRGDRVTAKITEQSGDGDGKIEPGETARVSLKGLHMPIPKMAGNYNPGFGGNSDGYSSVHLNYTVNGQTVYGPGTQYNFITAANYLDITIPEDIQTDKLTLTDGYIGVGVLGLTQFDVGGDSHRNIPDSGCGTRGSETTFHTRSILPEVTIAVEGAPVSVTGVKLDKSELTLKVGEAQTLKATVEPNDAENKAVTWSSDNLTVATAVDGTVTAVGVGTATITVTTADGAKTATCTVTVEAVPVETADVYFSVSHDAEFMQVGENNTVVALQKLTVPYFDLAQYGLGDFSLPKTHADYGKPTMLHLYIYATELFQYGISAEAAGKGYLKDYIGSPMFAYSGSPGSICLDQFWGMDMNLNYYHNYVFPADENGYGITADRVVLKDGDIVTIGHFTSWSFFGDSSSIFNYLVADGNTVVTTAAQNDALMLQVYRAGPDLGTGGNNTPVEAVRDVYYVKAEELSSGNVTSWTKLGTTDATGKLTADISDLPVGQYILAVAGQKGVEYPDDIVSTPGGILLNVTESTLSAAVQAVIAQIKAIGEVTLEKENAITAARSAYDALSEAEKKTVSNYAVLEAAEKALEELRQGQAAIQEVMDKIDAIGEVTLDSETQIQEAREAYDALADAQKELITNYETLTAAETTLAALQAAKADKEAARTVINLIEGIGEVSLDSAEEIEAARAAYEALTESQKALVTNYEVLTEAEETLRLLELSNADIVNIYQTTGNFLSGLEAPGVASINGEWRVIGLSRAGRSVPDAYYDAVVAYVKKNIDADGRLHTAKSSDNSRVILALTAIGKDVTDVGGYDLLSGLDEMDYIGNQGLNGYIWALLAFDSLDYPIPAGDVSRDALVNVILTKQLSDGGWALAGTVSDPDMTGMALAALAPYQSEADVAEAVEKALVCLSAMQNADGTFSSVTEGTTCESLAQVITGLTALGINPETDSRFIKNGVSAVDALSAFYVDGGGFKHGMTGSRNMMATEQAYYALVSYYRLLQGKTSLYDMSDVKLDKEAAAEVDALINAIGAVDLTKEDEIDAAREAYDDLTETQKKLVTNYKTLTDAETALAQLKQTTADTAAADAVKAQIDAIGTVTSTSQASEIEAARRAYNALTTLQKNLVGAAYLNKLEAAEDALDALEKAEADETAVARVIELINKIDTNKNKDGVQINSGSATAIQTARNAYNGLENDALRERVTNRQDLFAAEEAWNLLNVTISVTFELKGCYKHGPGETSVHTLAKGNLQTWIAAKTYKVQPGATVKDLFEQALAAAGMTWSNPTGNYVESITYNGQKIGEFTNGTYSGWMYTLNGKHPGLGVNQQTLVNGDKVVFHYTDDYTKEENSISNSGTTTSGTTNYITTTSTKVNTETAESVERLIDDIDEEITLDSEAKITAARAAYDKLTEEQKKLVENYDKLLEAEAALAELKGGTAENIYIETGDYIQSLGTPGVGNVGGEWMVIGLARSGRPVPSGYYDHVLNYVRENINDAEQLHSAKSSDNSRLILALTAIGKDVTNVDGHDLLEGLNNMDYIQKQGINGPIWALLAFDSGNYPVPEGNVSREKLIDVILEAQLSDGGWALSGERADPDMTAMAIQALAAYMDSDMDVKNAIDNAIRALSEMQNDNGSFSSVDGANSESIAQVIVALAALGIDADTDARFIKNGISALDALVSYYVPGGGFRHILDGNLDGMATEQAYYALVAYDRMLRNKNFLYDMTDVIDMGGDVIVEESTVPTQVSTEPVEEEEGNGNTVVIWTSVMTLCAGAIIVILLNRKKLFGKFM